MAGDVWAVLLAAGRGERFNLPYNKAFYEFNGRAVLSRSLDALCASGAFAGIALTLGENDLDLYHTMIARDGECPLVKIIVTGGSTRRDSARIGLSALPQSAEYVAIHDAARPFVAPDIIRACIASAREHGSGVPAMALTDTVKEADDRGFATRTLDREHIYTVQTPQVFRTDLIKRAHEADPGLTATDDAALYERAIGPVRLVVMPECADNIKITSPKDLKSHEAMTYRVGHGYDAHRLVQDRALILCGVNIPYDLGLLGHSDADVATHALMDALLGAAGLGDIGRHFPDNDPAYKGISSILLLEKAAALINARVINVDITIVAQKPKLIPYMEQMVNKIAGVLRVDKSCVNIKATTTEGMGFEGSGEGISAHAVALIGR